MEKPFLFTDLIPPDSNETEAEAFGEGNIPIKTWTTGSPYKIDYYADLYLRNSVEANNVTESFEGMLNYIAQNMQPDEDQEGDEESEAEEEEVEDDDDQGYADDHVNDDDANSNDDLESNIRNYFQNESQDGYQSQEYEQTFESLDEGGSMTEFFAKPMSANNDDDEEEDGEENEEEGDEDDGDADDDYNDGEYETEFEIDSEEKRQNDLKIVSEAFDQIMNSHEFQVKELLQKKQLHQQMGRHDEEDDDAPNQQEDESVASDLLDIMSDYNELMTYLQSPRDTSGGGGNHHTLSNAKLKKMKMRQMIQENNETLKMTKQASVKSVGSVEQKISKTKSSGAMVVPNINVDNKKPPKVKAPHSYDEMMAAQHQHHQQQSRYVGDTNDEDDEDMIPVKMKKSKKQQQAQSKVKGSGYGPDAMLPKKGKVDSAAAKKANKEARDKMKAMLDAIVEKRRQEEEEQTLLAQKAIAKRKKFKEALLEKAMRSRGGAGSGGGNNEGEEDEEQEETDVAVTAVPVKSAKVAVAAAAAPSAPVKKVNSSENTAAGATGATVKSDSVPGFYKTTKAFQVQSLPSKHAKQVIMTDEEAARQEQIKHDYIAAIRRKFKEQNKRMLEDLKSKHKEEERKAEEELLKEMKRKEKHKLKIMKLLAAKHFVSLAEAAERESSADHHVASPTSGRSNKTKPSAAAAAAAPAAASKPKKTGTTEKRLFSKAPSESSVVIDATSDVENTNDNSNNNNTSSNTGNSTGEPAITSPVAGSALVAIRKRASSSNRAAGGQSRVSDSEGESGPHQKRSQSVKVKGPRGGSAAAAIAAAAEELGDEEDEEVRRMRKVAAKLQQSKISAYLIALAEQKKSEETEKRKKEERAKKRAALLSQRMLLEINERKLMSANDHPRFQVSAPAEEVYQSHYVKRNEGKASAAAAAGGGGGAPAAPKSTKISAEAAEAMVNKLNKAVVRKSTEIGTGGPVSGSEGSAVPARDFNDWKRKNSVPSDGKVFCMTGWYPCVKQALLDRGWHFNPDNTSPYFHLKWTLRSIDVAQETLQPWQLTNHYLKNVAITTKAGLIKSLQSLVWLADVDAKDIIPRGYDLSIPSEMQSFIDDFRCQKADSILKKLYKRWTGLDHPNVINTEDEVSSSRPATTSKGHNQPDEDNEDFTIQKQKSVSPVDNSNNNNEGSSSNQKSDAHNGEDDLGGTAHFTVPHPPVPAVLKGAQLSDFKVNAAVFNAACTILERQIKPYEDSYIDDIEFDSNVTVTDLDWEILSTYSIDAAVTSLPSDPPEAVDAFLREKEDPDFKASATQRQEKRRIQRLEQQAREEASAEICKMRPVTEKDLARIHYILCSLMIYNRRQTMINGKGENSHNLWIVKPAAKSRGRGISTFIDLSKLLKYVEAGNGLSTQWVVQKYIENPLIIAKRKFDMRQWVVVTDWNPLTIYFYDEFYARFSVEEYSTEIADLENQYIHLVNNSIGKNSENFNKVICAENGVEVDGYMWSMEKFSNYLSYITGGKEVVKSKIQPRMKDIAKWSLMCASEMIEHRKNSWELYGFDFMVDDEFNAWLIEINSSPACDYSTSTTERYVQKALVELLTVVLDTREWSEQPRKERGPKPTTGGWECIYQGPLLDMPMGAFGTDMSLKGEGYKLAKKQYSGPPSFLSHHQQQVQNPQGEGSGGEDLTVAGTSSGTTSGMKGSLLPKPPAVRTGSNFARSAAAGAAAPPARGSGGGGGGGSSNPPLAARANSMKKTTPTASTAKNGVAAGSSTIEFEDEDDDDDLGGTTNNGRGSGVAAPFTDSIDDDVGGFGLVGKSFGSAKPTAAEPMRAPGGATMNNKSSKGGGGGTVSSGGGAAIPIKVFTVDF